MHPSHLRSGPQASQLRIQASRSGTKTVKLFGVRLLRSSYWQSSDNIVKEAYHAGALGDDLPIVERFAAKEDWVGAASAVGLPASLPTSVWAVRTVNDQRRSKLLPKVIWDEKTVTNSKFILERHANATPGNVMPAHLQGPTGASKTFAFEAVYSALGVPVKIIRAKQSSSDTINTELLKGGKEAKVDNRGEHAMANAEYGIFETPAAKYAYFKELAAEATKSSCSPVDAHGRISETAKDRIAALSGLPGQGDPAIGVRVYGMGEKIRRAGGVAVFDEFNCLTPDKLLDLCEFFNDQSADSPINSFIGLTSNPPEAGYNNRFPLTDDAAGRIHTMHVDGRGHEEHLAYIRSWFGLSDGAAEEHRREVYNFLVEDGISHEDAERILSSGHSKSGVISALLPASVLEDISDRLATLQASFEEGARDGGPLHPGFYGSQLDRPVPSIRSLASLLADWSRRTEDAILDEKPDLALSSVSELVRGVSPKVAIGSLRESVAFHYITPFEAIVAKDEAELLTDPDATAKEIPSAGKHAQGLVSAACLDIMGLMRLDLPEPPPVSTASYPRKQLETEFCTAFPDKATAPQEVLERYYGAIESGLLRCMSAALDIKDFRFTHSVDGGSMTVFFKEDFSRESLLEHDFRFTLDQARSLAMPKISDKASEKCVTILPVCRAGDSDGYVVIEPGQKTAFHTNEAVLQTINKNDLDGRGATPATDPENCVLKTFVLSAVATLVPKDDGSLQIIPLSEKMNPALISLDAQTTTPAVAPIPSARKVTKPAGVTPTK